MMSSQTASPSTVDIVCATGEAPFLARGRVRDQRLGTYTIDVDRDASHLPKGARVILSPPDGRSDRIVARVESALGNELICSQEQVRQRERREFPRLHGGLPVRYRRVPKTEFTATVARWLGGSEHPEVVGPEEVWRHPGRFMNYSVTGLRFRTEDAVSLHEIVLLELGVPEGPDRWRCTARCVHAGGQEADGTQVIALEFVQIPSAARAALTDMSLDAQAMLLG